MLIKKINKIILKNSSFCIKNEFSCIFSRTFSTPILSENNQQDLIVKSPLPSLEYPKISIDQFVWRNSEKWINKVAIVDGITDRSVTYAQLRDKCRTLAVRLRTTLNLQPKDTIAICIRNSIEFPIIALGACEAEIIVTTINPIYTSDEIARHLVDSNAKVIFGEVGSSKILQEAVQKAKRHIKIVYVKESSNDSIPADGIKFDELIEKNGLDLKSLPETDRDCNSVSFLPYSSGTTGLSKGVMLSHLNIISNASVLNNFGLTFDSTGDHQDVLPCVLPFFHISALVGLFISKLSQGCKLITLPKFHPDTFLNVLEKHQCNVLQLVPPLVFFFYNYDKIRPEHTRSIRYVSSGGAPLGASDIDQFLQVAPKTKFFQGYGLTETSPLTHWLPMDSKKYASVGNPVNDTEAKIIEVGDLNFKGIGPKKRGELLVRGPQVMLGYHNNEQATRDTITPDGWLRTGDIGYYDEDGDFYITDRLKELIKVKGAQVAPAELEEILRSHPEIADAAVIGIPNKATGELPRAYVVISKDSKLSKEDVQSFVAQKVSEFKRLAGGVEFVDEIPKNTTGKILRKELRKLYA